MYGNRIHNPASLFIFQKRVNVDIILTANPKKAPFSILSLAKLWSDSSFRLQTHVHSTIAGTVPKFTIRKDENNTPKNVINLRLIWKDGKFSHYIYWLEVI